MCKNTNYETESLNAMNVATVLEGKIVLFIGSAKILEREGSISSSSFYGKLPDYESHDFSLIYPVDEFSFKRVKTWGQCKISSYCFLFGVNQENEEAESSRFSCLTPVVETFSDRVCQDLEFCQTSVTELSYKNSQRP